MHKKWNACRGTHRCRLEWFGTNRTRNTAEFPGAQRGDDRHESSERRPAHINHGDSERSGDHRKRNAPKQLRHELRTQGDERRGRSHFHDLCFFTLEQRVELRHVLIMQLLQLFLGRFHFVF